MVLKIPIFNAARDGNLQRLKIFLEHKPRDEVEMLVSSYTNEATPLIIACQNGHHDVAAYLLKKCGADIEQVGSVTIDGETIEGAPPLWCASAAGHLNLVKLLISHNACVNSTTKSNSTPLRAACFDGHFGIATYLIKHGANIEIANRHGHTCLMIACYKGHFQISKFLLECGADINRKSVKGSTALHDCAESGSLEILQMILSCGAQFDADSCGTTPLLSAAINGHSNIVEYFIEQYNLSKLDKINALELLGATYMDRKRDLVTAINYWRRAMCLRYDDPSLFLPKKLNKKSSVSAYFNTTEVCTFSQLNNLVSDPDEMRMQALLVRERILGPGHPDTVYYLRFRGAAYAENGNFERCIQLWSYALDVQHNALEPFSPLTQSILHSFVELFSFMMSENWVRTKTLPISIHDLTNVFERALKGIEDALESNHNQEIEDILQFHRTLVIVLHLIGLMCRLQPQLNKTEDLELKKAVYKLVHINPRSKNGWTPLHIACFKDKYYSSIVQYPVCIFPSQEVVELLLEVGACPNVVDFDNNTPLHIVAMNKPVATAVFKTLLNHGAHLDLSNDENKTPLELLESTPVSDLYPLRHINLQCLSAQIIRLHRIPYKGLTHKKLETFIDAH